MPEPRKLRVFLCHASQDKPVVRELYRRLLAEGWIDPWLDEKKLLPGQDWDVEIEKAVESADAVIVFLSINSVTKEGYIQKELRKVLDVASEKPEGNIFIIPVRLGECQIPRTLMHLQVLSYFPGNVQVQAYKILLQSLTIRADALGISGEPTRPRYQAVFIDDYEKTIQDFMKLKNDGQVEIVVHAIHLSLTVGGGYSKRSRRFSFDTPVGKMIETLKPDPHNPYIKIEVEIKTPVKSVLLGNLLDDNSVCIFKPILMKEPIS